MTRYIWFSFSSRVLNVFKIIERARQNHILEKFRSQTTSLTSALLNQVRQSWKAYMRTRVNKGLAETDKATEGTEEATWSRILDLYTQPEWKQECLKRDEKFDMHYSSSVRTQRVSKAVFLNFT